VLDDNGLEKQIRKLPIGDTRDRATVRFGQP